MSDPNLTAGAMLQLTCLFSISMAQEIRLFRRSSETHEYPLFHLGVVEAR